MDHAELLKSLQHEVKEFEKLQGLIQKAKSQAGKFSAAVVEKVIADNTKKSLDVVERIMGLMSDTEDVIGTLRTQREDVLASCTDAKMALQECELRHVIGEYDEAEFVSRSASPRQTVEQADTRVAGFDAELEKFDGAVSQWQEIGSRAGVLA